MERKCAVCSNMVVIDQTNSHKAIHYKNSFYHYDCFGVLCDTKIAHKSKAVSERWSNIKPTTDELVEVTTKEQRAIYDKDVFNRWLMQQYGLSFMTNAMYIQLDSVYKGTYHGLAYAIEPFELYSEWQYYWEELCAIRQSKGIVGELAIRYDLVIILRKNAEYRSIKEKERISQELRKQQMIEETLVNIDTISQTKTRKQSKNKIADLYKELNGGEDHE